MKPWLADLAVVDIAREWLKAYEELRHRQRRTVEVALPVEAIQLLYDVLGHFPHEPGSWSHIARSVCSDGLWSARNQTSGEDPGG